MKKYYINKYTIIMIFAIIIGAISQPLIAYAFMSLDSVINNFLTIEFSYLRSEIFTILVAMMFASLSHFIKDYVSNYEMNHLRKDVFFSIINKSSSEFHESDSSEYYNFVLKKIDAWQSGYYEQVWNIIQFILELSCIYYLIFSMNVIAGFISILILVPLIINNIIFPNIIGKAYNDFLNQDSRMVSKLKELLAGFDCIKNCSGEKFFSRKMNFFFDITNSYNQSVSKLNNISGTVANVCVVASQVSGICIGLILIKEKIIGIGQFVALVQLLSYVNEPVIKLINSTVAFASVTNVNRELYGVISKCKECYDIQTDEIKAVRLKDISFRYEGKQDYVITRFNFIFEMGKKYLIIGESGSGKSTLIKIIMGVIDKYEGYVYFNDCIMSENQINHFIGLVSQNIFIFNDTIRNNVDLLHVHSDEEVENAIIKAELNNFVESKQDRMNSQISEEVIQVSGGERSRIGLARAFLENKPIIIFDEILSNLDEDNAYKIEKKILKLEGKMVIHVAHNYSRDLTNLYDQIIDLSEI